MKSYLNEALRIVLPLGILLVGIAGFGFMKSRQRMPDKIQEKVLPLLVETAAVLPFGERLDLNADGLVVPFREITLAAEVAGRVVFKSPDCRAGRYVKQGTLLVEIDPQTYQLEVQRLGLEFEQAKASLDELNVEQANAQRLVELAENQFGLQQKNTERIRTLFSRKMMTDANVDEALRLELTTRNSVMTLQNELQMIDARRARLTQARDLVQTRLNLAKLDVERTQVTAPVDGVIVSDAVEQNGYVQPGTSLLTIEDTSAVEVRCNLRMEQIRWVLEQNEPVSLASSEVVQPEVDYQLPETPVSIVYSLGNAEYVWKGTLTRYDGIGLDQQTRTVPVRVVVSQPRAMEVRRDPNSSAIMTGPRALVRGMFVKAIVHVQPRTHLLKVSERALQPGGVVWRVRDAKLNLIPVKTALVMEDEDSVLLEGDGTPLQAGDKLVVSPVAVPVEGMAVREESLQ